MEELLIKLYSKPSKYEKVFGGKCSLTFIAVPLQTFELSSHMLGWKINNVLRSLFLYYTRILPWQPTFTLACNVGTESMQELFFW